MEKLQVAKVEILIKIFEQEEKRAERNREKIDLTGLLHRLRH